MSDIQNSSETQDIARRLRSVTRRIETFFESQIQRLHAALDELRGGQAEYETARRLSADLQAQRVQWESRRQQEMCRLVQASQKLASSWHELEQRQLEIEAARSRPGAAAPQPRQVQVVGAGAVATAAHAVAEASPGGLDLFEMKQLQSQVNRHKRRGR